MIYLWLFMGVFIICTYKIEKRVHNLILYRTKLKSLLVKGSIYVYIGVDDESLHYDIYDIILLKDIVKDTVIYEDIDGHTLHMYIDYFAISHLPISVVEDMGLRNGVIMEDLRDTIDYMRLKSTNDYMGDKEILYKMYNYINK